MSVEKLLYPIYKKKLWLLLLFLSCIFRSIVVLFLNKGYASLIDNTLLGAFDLLANSTILLVCTGSIQVVIIIVQNLIASLLCEKVGCDLRAKAFEGILKGEYKTIENLSTGETLSKLNTDLSGVTTWIKGDLSALLSEGVLFIVVFTVLLYTNPKLTILSFFIVPFFSVGSYLLSKPITSAEEEKNKAVEEFNIISKSIMDAFPIFKLFDMKQPLLKKVDERINLSNLAEMKANNVRAKLMSINGFIAYMPTAIIFGVGGYMAINGSITAGELLAFINMSNFVTGPLLNLPARIDGIRTSSANAVRVFNILERLRYEGKGEVMMSERVEEIAVEFRGVSFGYTKDKRSIRDVSFKVPRGSKVAIVGESGSGKSTILKLIAGLYEVEEGEVFVFGANIKSSDLSCVRKEISYIPQEAQLFPVSIYENITCGHTIPREKVIDACKASQLCTLINNLPEGIDTNIGEQGSKLSGGEGQRVAIARAIAKDASIFLLDEATSALDGKTESDILKFFDSLAGRKTIIFVTHKLANAVNADLIICMKNGQISEAGTHQELIKADNYYAGLYKIQNMLEVLLNERDKTAVS